jgi:hypothetical protein
MGLPILSKLYWKYSIFHWKNSDPQKRVYSEVGWTAVTYRVWQKYLTILKTSCKWNCWRGEFVLERPSNETQSISVAMKRWSVEHKSFRCGHDFQKQRNSRCDSVDISSALQYSSERVSLVAILLPLGISQEQGIRKETKDNGGLETEHQERTGSNFSKHAVTSDAELPETLAGKC